MLAPYSAEIASAGEAHRFPVQSKITGEPLLVSAVLIQRGKVRVARNTPQQAPAIDQVATQTIKCLVHRDQTADWNAVVSHPVKYIFSQVKELQTCKEEACKCNRWHPRSKPQTSPSLMCGKEITSPHNPFSEPRRPYSKVTAFQAMMESFGHRSGTGP